MDLNISEVLRRSTNKKETDIDYQSLLVGAEGVEPPTLCL